MSSQIKEDVLHLTGLDSDLKQREIFAHKNRHEIKRVLQMLSTTHDIKATASKALIYKAWMQLGIALPLVSWAIIELQSNCSLSHIIPRLENLLAQSAYSHRAPTYTDR